jgi:hypothetical protein
MVTDHFLEATPAYRSNSTVEQVVQIRRMKKSSCRILIFCKKMPAGDFADPYT